MSTTVTSGNGTRVHVGPYRPTSQIPVSAWVPPPDRTPACAGVDPDLFYPEPGNSRATTGAARRVCAGCGLRVECEAAAVAQRERHGVWGGLSPRERGMK